MKLYLIRHLPTAWNTEGRLQGSRDISINETDSYTRIQIQKNLELLEKLTFDKVFVSTLKRTKETAKEYNFKSFEVEPLIDELNFGKYEGKKKELMLNDLGDDWFNKCSEIILGESLSSFSKRINDFLEKYKGLENVLVFSHGAVIRSILSLIDKGSIDEMNQLHIENNSLTTIIYESTNCS